MRRHTITAQCPMGNEGDGFDVSITYTFIKGQPEEGPSYASGGQPAEPAEVEFVSVQCRAGLLIDTPEIQKVLDDWAIEALADSLYENAVENAMDYLNRGRDE